MNNPKTKQRTIVNPNNRGMASNFLINVFISV
jgi:hypothetical protein